MSKNTLATYLKVVRTYFIKIYSKILSSFMGADCAQAIIIRKSH